VDNSKKIKYSYLRKFYGISELYYYIGETGHGHRSKVIQATVKTDALGLPFITIPLSNVDRDDTVMTQLTK